MRSLVILSLLAACELKPPPPKADVGSGSGSAAVAAAVITPIPAPPPKPTPPPTPPPVVVPPQPIVGGGSGSDGIAQPAISPECAELAVHMTDVLIQISKPEEHAFMVQDRARTVQRVQQSCARGRWNADKIKCFGEATTREAIDACNKLP